MRCGGPHYFGFGRWWIGLRHQRHAGLGDAGLFKRDARQTRSKILRPKIGVVPHLHGENTLAAIDKLNYAKSIDPEVASKANKYIAAYKGSVPQKSTAFALGYKEGDRYTIGCWINESVVMNFY